MYISAIHHCIRENMSLSPCDGCHFGGQISIVHNAGYIQFILQRHMELANQYFTARMTMYTWVGYISP